MSLAPIRLSAEAEDAMLEGIRAQLEGGELHIYDSIAPSTANASPSSQQHLATVTVTDALLGDGQIRATIEQGLAIGSGQASWARAYTRDGKPLFDCDVGESRSGAAIELNTVAFRKGGPVAIRNFSLGVRR